ncbi:MAG: PQQ-dependent sugar dehydrogenase [Patescibacteria group bacterium]|nr:PQQ-dependent sugar dehydrogenase [Patescibacteria group bacterium]
MKKNKLIIIISILIFLVIIGFSLAAYFLYTSSNQSESFLEVLIDRPVEISEKIDSPLIYPDDFELSIFAEKLGKVRDILAAPAGIIVSSMQAGKVIYLPDRNNDGVADEKVVLLENRYNPHGLVDHCFSEDECWLYLAETDAIYRFRYDKIKMKLGEEERIVELPDDGGHYTRDVLIKDDLNGPRLYISVGSKCNACVEKDWRRAKILVSNLDGSNLKEYASGLRNSVFITLNPFNNEIYAADMGRDWLGDSLPLEEINIIQEYQDYGWPACHGNKIQDTEFDNTEYERNPCTDTISPIITMPAHSAPLGLDFIPEEGFGDEYKYNLLVAQHGSWNRSTPIGYQVVRMKLDIEGNYTGTEEFLSGFLSEGEAWGRPADVLTLPGGKIYVSDDQAGSIYLLQYKQQ